jgi:hypothetical protein
MSEFHPSTVMSGADARSRKRYGGFASLLEKSCRSATDPIFAVSKCGPFIQSDYGRLTYLRSPAFRISFSVEVNEGAVEARIVSDANLVFDPDHRGADGFAKTICTARSDEELTG